ncbi:MAG: hypothetical protein HN548_04870 [Opitutae bacterium]|jgi:hypothetical protein|nr:hypothetical protein [Opitutae bacterium]
MHWSSWLIFLIPFALSGKTDLTLVRQTIEKSIPYVELKGQQWIKKNKCVSCHQINTMIWSLSLAKKKGFTVSEKLGSWIEWSVEESLNKNKKGKLMGRLNKEGVAQILFADLEIESSQREKLLDLLALDQKKDGTWDAGGQLPAQKRPAMETFLVSSSWIALSARQEVSQVSIPTIRAYNQGKSIEWYVVNLLLSFRNGDDKVNFFINKLKEFQNPDGGWGWLVNDQSDALGTGMALYALEYLKSEKTLEARTKAIDFLIRTKRTDGTWLVKGTKRKKRDKLEETSIYWGTAWAIIGLTSGLSENDH